MNFQEYQDAVQVTANRNLTREQCLSNWGLGIAGEAGEVIELIKKHLYHGKELDILKCEKEIGDLLFYVSALATTLNLHLENIAVTNIVKLRARYGDSFKLGGGIREEGLTGQPSRV